MTETVEALERRIDQLRVAVREAVLASEQARARDLRTELRRGEGASEGPRADAAGGAAPAAVPPPDREANPSQLSAPRLPLREQVYEALSLLQVPAAPKL